MNQKGDSKHTQSVDFVIFEFSIRKSKLYTPRR